MLNECEFKCMPVTENLKRYTDETVTDALYSIDGTVDLESKEDQLKGTFKTHNIQDLCLQEIMTKKYCMHHAIIKKGSILNTRLETALFLWSYTPLWSNLYSPWRASVNRKAGHQRPNSKWTIIKLDEEPVRLMLQCWTCWPWLRCVQCTVLNPNTKWIDIENTDACKIQNDPSGYCKCRAAEEIPFCFFFPFFFFFLFLHC